MKRFVIAYDQGDSLEESFFVGKEELTDAEKAELQKEGKAAKEPVVVRATYILHPHFVSAVKRIASSDATDEDKKKQLAELAVQPEQYVEHLKQACTDLESFRTLAMGIAETHRKGLEVTAAGGSPTAKAPTYATEPQDKIKVGDEPTVAAESAYVPDKGPSLESAPAVRSYFARLPSKGLGEYEMALDMSSSNVAVREALKQEQVKTAALEDQLKKRAKEDEMAEVLDLLTEVGVVEDVKDREKYSKDLAGLDERALGVIEKLLKDVRSAGEPGKKKPAEPSGAPKPPAAGGAKPPETPKMGAPAGLPAMSSQANLFQASMPDEMVPGLRNFPQNYGQTAQQLSVFWQTDNASRPYRRQ